MIPRGENIIYAMQRARRCARELARAEKIALGRFRLVKGSDSPDSLIGTEWVADELRNGSGHAFVWMPIGEKNINEALRTCTVCRYFGKWFFGIGIRGVRKD